MRIRTSFGCGPPSRPWKRTASPRRPWTRPLRGPSANARLAQSLRDIESELRLLKEEEVRLRQAIGAYEQRVENMPRREEEFQTLSRDHATAKERYDTLLKRYEEAQLAESLERGRQTEQFRILDPATPPGIPPRPPGCGSSRRA